MTRLLTVWVSAFALLIAGACSSGGAEVPREPSAGTAPTYLHRVAKHMVVPWGVGFLPSGAALVTERATGRIYRVKDGARRTYVGRIRQSAPSAEGGLLGLAVSPDFAHDRRIFVYVSTATDNRVLSMTYRRGALGPRRVVLSGIPGAPTHDGGRIAFGPDGFLYVSTGDARKNPNPAPDVASLGGKILRITAAGEPAPGNPFPDSAVWTYGHRNVQGLAWDAQGRLWASEFGWNAYDEINLIEPGKNYGWPVCEGDFVLNSTTPCAEEHPDLAAPAITFTTDVASPSGLAYADGALWMAGLRGRRLHRLQLDGPTIAASTVHFQERWGRLRTVVPTPQGRLWLTTSNRDGRGTPTAVDDQILLIQP